MEKSRSKDNQKRKRILTLDLIRGLFLLIIFGDHLGFSPSLPFEYFTNNSAAFASAAEGFFVISGILVGYIYKDKILHHTTSCIQKLWRRAGLLYILSVIFTLFYTFWAYTLPEGHTRVVPMTGSWYDIILHTLTLQYQFGWADFLARYAVFMLFAPLIVWLIAKRFEIIVIGASLLIWLFFREQPILQMYTAWQLIFVCGIVIGHHLTSIESFIMRIPYILRLSLWWGIIAFAVFTYTFAVLWMNVITINWSPPGVPVAYLPYFDKNSLAIGRLVIGIIWFLGLFLFFRKFEEQINRATKGLLLMFGKNSLFVYSAQSIVIFSMDVIFPHNNSTSVLLNTFIYIISVLCIYLAVFLRDKLRIVYKNRGESILIVE